MAESFTDLFDWYAAAAFNKQYELDDLVGDRPLRVNWKTGVLQFGDDITWRMQVLGSESEEVGTWLWSWANEEGNIPSAMIEAALWLRAFGQERGLAELAEPERELGKVNGEVLSALASGLTQANAYYRGPYHGGAAFFLITDPKFPRAEKPDPINRILSVFPLTVSHYLVNDHRRAFLGCLDYFGLEGRPEGDDLEVWCNGQLVLNAEFDDLRRLKKLSGTIGGRQPPSQAP